MPADIDSLKPNRSLIDLADERSGDFGLDNYVLSKIFNDVILVDLIDEENDGEVNRGGILVQTSSMTKAWRKGKVLLKGSKVSFCEEGDIVIFPNDKGVTVSNIVIKDHGKIKKGMFLNEERVFGVCELNTDNG